MLAVSSRCRSSLRVALRSTNTSVPAVSALASPAAATIDPSNCSATHLFGGSLRSLSSTSSNHHNSHNLKKSNDPNGGSSSSSSSALQQSHDHVTHPYSSTAKSSLPKEPSNRVADVPMEEVDEDDPPPGSRAFVECDRSALIDLFHKYAVDCDVSGRYLNKEGLAKLLKAVGEQIDPPTLERLFETADMNGDGSIELHEFLHGSDMILGGAPAGIVLVVGGPGSGKGVLSKRLERECGVVHLSSGDLLRDEVKRNTVLGRQVRDIMAKGELVSSAVIVTLMRRVMRNHPGKRVLLDGFPRSLQNAHDLVELCGTPELALHLECDDTLLMERILKRGDEASTSRSDDNIYTALKRLRTYHTYHNSTLEWLREQHVPVVNLDCTGSADSVWEQLCAIGRLMRPATRIDPSTTSGILPTSITDRTTSDDSKVA